MARPTVDNLKFGYLMLVVATFSLSGRCNPSSVCYDSYNSNVYLQALSGAKQFCLCCMATSLHQYSMDVCCMVSAHAVVYFSLSLSRCRKAIPLTR